MEAGPVIVGAPSVDVPPVAVAGNVAVIVPLLKALLVAVAPATLKKFIPTPIKVYPAFGVSVMVAV
jgi:hypothetical protein